MRKRIIIISQIYLHCTAVVSNLVTTIELLVKVANNQATGDPSKCGKST